MEKKYKDGSVWQVLVIALPMIISCSCDTIMIFTDRLFLSRISPQLMNAAMGGGVTIFMLLSFFIGLIGYSSALVAQYLGAGKKNYCTLVITQTVIISFVAFPLVFLFKPLGYILFERMGISAEQLAPQKIYFDILAYGALISLLRNTFASFFSGIGRTSIVMIASFSAMIVNVIANYILIYGKLGSPALGIKGAAYGTLLGGASGLLILLLKYFFIKQEKEFKLKESFRFDFAVIKKLLRFGFPTGLEMFLNIFAFNLIVLMFHAQGLVVATAVTITFNWDLVAIVPLIGLEIAITSLVGRFMGRSDPDTAHKSVISSLKVGMIYSFIIFMLFTFFSTYLVNIFRPQVEDSIFLQAFPLAIFMVRLAAIYVLVEAILIVFIGALRGAGDTFWAMVISVSLHWAIVLVLFLLLKVFNFSPRAGWIAVVSFFFVFSGVVFLRYRSGKWREIKVVSREPQAFIPDVFPEDTEF